MPGSKEIDGVLEMKNKYNNTLNSGDEVDRQLRDSASCCDCCECFECCEIFECCDV